MKMKDSGLEWLGDIPAHWKICRLKFLAEMYTGNSISDVEKENYTARTDIPYISTKDIDLEYSVADYENGLFVPRESNFKIAPAGSTLLCIEGGSAGRKKTYIIRSVAFVNKLCAFIPEKIYDKFLYYEICSATFKFQFDRKLTGIIGGVSINTIKNFSIPLPPLDEQQKISAYLDKKCAAIDTAVDAAKKMVVKLGEYKKDLITETVTKGLNPAAKMQDSGVEWLGDIPAHCKIIKLKYLVSIVSKGTTPSTVNKEILNDGDIRFIKAENIKENHISLEPNFFIDSDTNELLKRSQLQNLDILFVIAGATIGKTAIVENIHLPANTNQAVSFIRVKNFFSVNFIWYYLQSYYVKMILKLLSVQSAQPNISMEDIKNFSIPLPPLEEQKEISAFLDSKCAAIDENIAKHQQLAEKLTEYKKSLIYEVVTGKMEV